MVEDIVLESPVQAERQLTPPEGEERHVSVEYTLNPKFSRHEYHYRLFNECFLEIERCDKQEKEDPCTTAFHVGLLESKPKKIRRSSWVTFLGSLLTGFAAIGIGVMLGDYWLAAGTGILGLLLFINYYVSCREVSFFYSRSGKAPLLSLSHRCQCSDGLNDFVGRLKESIEKNTLPASSPFFAEETRLHRNLMEQGWISREDYEKAKSRIMKQFAH
ncbi:hypothetical protein [Pleionea sp. CnH1-48]|uniref:hypothetical protein n=1 Tax=Pleionea sp. CnH1-48 TaxID=2954494 RepID=UPI002096B831|nr:hypothetical protein [Pleionea sp. CnH1-48]MCO7225162.1 hypothetical protein [Pleionea sp. CnH1-48]